jgi:hypothetical protein
MKRQAAKWIGPLLVLFMVLAPSTASAQKSLSDGIDDLATKLARSYGSGAKGRVAIVPLRALAGSENLLGTYIAEILTNSFFEAGYRDMVERQMLDRAIQELKLNLTGMIDPESAKKIGKFLNADFVVGGTMTEFTGEVSVICRMFAVQTGEVVAVATTKIVKDDSVKSMLTKVVGSPASATRAPTDGGQGVGEIAQEVEGISFRLKSCTPRGGIVECVLSITALDGDVAIRLSTRDSRLIDANGQEVSGPKITYSSGNVGFDLSVGLDLVSGIVRTGHIRFEGVDVAKGEVPLIEIRFRGVSRGARGGVVQFRNVKIQ